MRHLAARCIPVAVEDGEHLGKLGAEGDWYRAVVEKGHFGGGVAPCGTRQGIYLCTPAGELLASLSINETARTIPQKVLQALRMGALGAPHVVGTPGRKLLSTLRVMWTVARQSDETAAERTARELERGLARWDAMPPGARRAGALRECLVADEPRPAPFPEDGLALQIVTRDLPRDEETTRGFMTWNLDHAWFDAGEAALFLPEPLAAGASRELPARLARRLARLHLLDNVRGVTEPFEDGDVQTARLETVVTAIDGDTVTLAIRGETRTEAVGRWPLNWFEYGPRPGTLRRGVETTLSGEATYDRSLARFTALEIVAVGKRWGGTQYNYRARDLGPHPIGFHLTLVGGLAVDRIEPAYFSRYRSN